MMLRSGNLTAWFRTPVATACAALSVIVIAAGTAWSQGNSVPPALGLREAPQQAAPQPATPAPPSPPAGEESPGLIHEMSERAIVLSGLAKKN